MRTIARAAAASAGAAALAIGVLAGSAAAAPAGSAGQQPGGFGAFVLTSDADSAGLICSPDLGSHPDPARACDSIRQAHGDFTALSGDPHTMCPYYMDIDGYPASALGFWIDAHGAHLADFRHNYANGCLARNQSGGVFGF